MGDRDGLRRIRGIVFQRNGRVVKTAYVWGRLAKVRTLSDVLRYVELVGDFLGVMRRAGGIQVPAAKHAPHSSSVFDPSPASSGKAVPAAAAGHDALGYNVAPSLGSL